MLRVGDDRAALQHILWYLFLPEALYFVFGVKKSKLLTGVYFSSPGFLQQNPT